MTTGNDECHSGGPPCALPALDQAGVGPPAQLATLVAVAQWRAAVAPQQTLFIFLGDGETESGRLTYGQLDTRARAIAAELQARGAAGQRVLLLFEPGLEFVTGLFGCLYAGAVPVPATPPDPLRLGRTLPRLRAIAGDTAAEFVLGAAAPLAAVGGNWGNAARATLVAAEDIADETASAWRSSPPDPQALAVLQYTSGSTGAARHHALPLGRFQPAQVYVLDGRVSVGCHHAQRLARGRAVGRPQRLVSRDHCPQSCR